VLSTIVFELRLQESKRPPNRTVLFSPYSAIAGDGTDGNFSVARVVKSRGHVNLVPTMEARPRPPDYDCNTQLGGGGIADLELSVLFCESFVESERGTRVRHQLL